MSPIPAAGRSQELLIEGPGGAIDAILSAPRIPLASPVFAVICHPHPLMGGAMSNKVAYTLASAAQKAGLYALRFNFRGVGRSAGKHDQGRGETDDVVFLAQWLAQQLPDAHPVLMGFSFGAWVSLRAAQQVRPLAQVSIAPPFTKYFHDQPPPPRPDCPWLVMHGLDDEVVAYAETRAVLDTYAPPPQLITLDGVGHFFHGRLNDITEAVVPFLQTQLQAS